MTLATTELPPEPAIVAAPPSTPEAAQMPWRRPAPLALGTLAFLLCVAWTNRVFLFSGTLRSALLLTALGPGVVALVFLVLRRDRAAIAASAFLVVAGVSTAVAHEPLMSLFGEYFTRTGLLFLAACMGLWALGRCDPRTSAPVIAVAILAGATVNAALGWLQVSTDIGIRGLESYGGRASGLLGNPVFLSGLCAGATWLALAWERRARRALVPLLLTVLLVGAVQLSGGRSGLLAVVVGGIWFIGGHLREHRPWRALAVLGAIALGILLALVPPGSSGSASERAQGSASSGLSPRLAVWEAGVRSVEDRPLLGAGPGRFVEAATPRRGLVSVRYEGRDVLLGDAHNVFVEILATTGVLGLLAFAAWLVLAGRTARGALAGFAALVGITMLFEPLDLAVTPLVALALGAATVPKVSPPVSAAGRRLLLGVGGVLALVGLVLGVRLVAGDVSYRVAVTTQFVSELQRAERLSPPWPQYPGVRAQILEHRAEALNDRNLGRRAIAAERDAVARDPSDPRWHSALAALEERWGSVARARREFQKALQRNPWSYTALIHLYGLELRAGDKAAALRARARLCEIGRSECPPTPEVIERIQRSQAKAQDGRRASTP